jgi:hypothetical protein
MWYIWESSKHFRFLIFFARHAIWRLELRRELVFKRDEAFLQRNGKF